MCKFSHYDHFQVSVSKNGENDQLSYLVWTNLTFCWRKKNNMEQKREKIIAYCAAIILFLLGVVCYAAFGQKTPEDPIRIYFQSSAGNVLFDHKEHTSKDGYGLDCTDCHHEYDEDEGTKPEGCGQCHGEDEDILKKSEAFHENCIVCHEDSDGGPKECSECHAL